MEARQQQISAPTPETEITKLIAQINSLESRPVALGLAVQVELIFSSILLERCLALAAENYTVYADHILQFLMARTQRLEGTAAYNPHTRSTRLNRAFLLTAKSFSVFNKDNFTLKQILNFDKVCNEKEMELLKRQEDKIEAAMSGATRSAHDEEISNSESEAKIYKFVYDLVFNVQSIPNAMSFIPKKDDVLNADNWQELLRNIIKYIPDRKTFIRIVSFQVEKKDWPYFFAQVDLRGLYKLVLNLSLKKHLDAHEKKPVMKQGVHELNNELLEAADKLLHSTFDNRSFYGFFATPGEAFRAGLEKQHDCENQLEVSALAYALIYSYSRVRLQLPKYSGRVTKVWDIADSLKTMFTINGKDEKLDACKVIMSCILEIDTFTEVGLHRYVESEATAGRITKEAVLKFKQAIGEGGLKSLLDAIFDVQKLVDRMQPPRPHE